MTRPEEIAIEAYDYPLPDERIAQHPLKERDKCKLLYRDRSGKVTDAIFSDIVSLLPDDTLLLYNNTRVINARLRFRKGINHDGATIEIFCLEPVSPADYSLNFASVCSVEWKCFVGNSKRWKDDTLSLPLIVGGNEVILEASRLSKEGNASIVRLSWNDNSVTFSEIIEAAGEIPIPPYLNRSTEESDSEDYQTVYSNVEGSVAAPTAGLHFTPSLLDTCRSRGIEIGEVTLHVGAGTFQPVKSELIGDHEMHSEFISVSRSMIEKLASTSRHIIAVGTTSVRTLESLYHLGCMLSKASDSSSLPELEQWYPYSVDHPNFSVGEAMKSILSYLDKNGVDTFIANTRLIIAPGYKYRVIDGMITNFHQPRSTLLLLVSALIGEDWRNIYRHALDEEYRFLSYGDACLFMKPVN